MASSFDTANHGYKVLLGTSNKPKQKGVPNMAGQRKFPTPGGNGKLSDLVHRSTDPKPSLSSGPYVPGQGGGLIQLDAMPQQQPIGQGQPYQMTVSPVVGGQPVGGRLEVDPNNPWAGGPPQRRLDPLVGAPAYDSVTEQINRIREEAAMSRSGIPQAPAAPQMPAYGTVSEQAPPPPPPPQMPGQMPPVSSQATQMPQGGMSQGPPVMGRQPTFPPVPQAAPQAQPQQSRPWQQPATAESLDQTLRSLYEGGLAPQDKQQIEDWAIKAWDDGNLDADQQTKLMQVLLELDWFSRPRQGQNEGQAQPQQQPAQPATPQQAPPTVAQQVGAAAAPQPQQPQQAMPPQEQLPAEAGRLAEMLGGPSRTEANPYRPADISSLSEADRKDIIDRMTRQSGPDPGGPMGAEALTRGGLAGVQGDLSGHLQDGNWNAANAALKQQSSDRNAAARDKRAAMTQGLRGDMYEGSLIPGTQYEHVNMNMPGRPNRWVTRGGNVSGASRPGTAGDAGQQYHGTGMLGDSRAPFNPMTSEQEDRESTMMEILNQNRSGGRDAQNAALVQAGFPELRGLSVESPGLRENERFQASRQNRKGEMYLRRALITDREELKGDQRRARIAERKRVPTRGEIAMQRAFNRNPRLAMDMMRMRQRGNLGQQQLGLQEFIAANRESGAQRRHEEIMSRGGLTGFKREIMINNLMNEQGMPREDAIADINQRYGPDPNAVQMGPQSATPSSVPGGPMPGNRRDAYARPSPANTALAESWGLPLNNAGGIDTASVDLGSITDSIVGRFDEPEAGAEIPLEPTPAEMESLASFYANSSPPTNPAIRGPITTLDMGKSVNHGIHAAMVKGDHARALAIARWGSQHKATGKIVPLEFGNQTYMVNKVTNKWEWVDKSKSSSGYRLPEAFKIQIGSLAGTAGF